MNENILLVNNLNRSYKDSSFKLNNINMTLKRGTIMGLVGENGAGKTTLLRSILGLSPRNSGVVRIFGKNIDEDLSGINAKIGVVFDELHFPEELTLKNMDLILGNMHPGWDSKYFSSLCRELDLDPTKKIKAYSKGMKMKLSIASALGHRPELLILDEPTSGLDPVMRNHILEVLDQYIKDASGTILFSTHITSDLEKIADEVTFIHKGKILLWENKDNLMSHYGLLKINAQATDCVDRIAIEDVVSAELKGDPMSVLVRHKDRYQGLEGCITKGVNIEDVLLEIIKGGRFNERLAY